MFDQTAYEHVIVNELVLDPEGQKMSKSRGNVVDPWEMIREFGADTIRVYLLASSQVWLPKRFDRRTIPEVAGGFFNTLRNTYGFFSLYAGALAAGPGAAGRRQRSQMDRWLLSRLDATIEAVRAHWGGYDVTAGTRAVMDFVVDDLSNWYVRLSRSRFWAPDREADPAAVATLHEALTDGGPAAGAGRAVRDRLAAPGARGNLGAPRAVSGGSGAARVRARARPWTRSGGWPRSRGPRATTRTSGCGSRSGGCGSRSRRPSAGRRSTSCWSCLRLEVNVKDRWRSCARTPIWCGYEARPNFRSLGKRFGKRTPDVAAAAARLTPGRSSARSRRARAVALELDGETITYLPEDLTIEREVTSDWIVKTDGPYVVALDPVIDDALKSEGFAREVINRVQRLRKEAGYEYTTRIHLWIDGERVAHRGAPAARRLHRGGDAWRGAWSWAPGPSPPIWSRSSRSTA